MLLRSKEKKKLRLTKNPVFVEIIFSFETLMVVVTFGTNSIQINLTTSIKITNTHTLIKQFCF